MVIHYPPERLRSNSDRPSAITDVLVATTGSSSTGEISLGAPTCSARTRHGRWALYPNGDQRPWRLRAEQVGVPSGMSPVWEDDPEVATRTSVIAVGWSLL